jgi:hypothetical protein
LYGPVFGAVKGSSKPFHPEAAKFGFYPQIPAFALGVAELEVCYPSAEYWRVWDVAGNGRNFPLTPRRWKQDADNGRMFPLFNPQLLKSTCRERVVEEGFCYFQRQYVHLQDSGKELSLSLVQMMRGGGCGCSDTAARNPDKIRDARLPLISSYSCFDGDKGRLFSAIARVEPQIWK